MSLLYNTVCISEWERHRNVITTAFPLHLVSPDSTVIRWNESPCCWGDGDNRMIHSLSKEVTTSCAFTTGIWDSLSARSEGQQAKRPIWHTELAVVWIRSKHLKSQLIILNLQKSFPISTSGICLILEGAQIQTCRNKTAARTPKITNKLWQTSHFHVYKEDIDHIREIV